MAIQINFDIGGLAQIVRDIGQPVRRIGEIDNAQRDIALLLIRLAEQPPALGRAAQAVNIAHALLGGNMEQRPDAGTDHGASQQHQPAHQSRGHQQADEKE